MKRLAVGVILLIVLGGAGLLVARGARLKSRQVAPGTPASVTIDAPAAANRLAGALQFATISWGDATKRDTEAFEALADYLERTFPRVHQTLTRESIAQHSLLYTWLGRNPSLPPIILASHLDVVPIEPDTEATWTHPPFGGVVADGSVWGRGAIDDKAGVLGLLEAVDALLASGFKPMRTVYLAFGHNEEGGGDPSGAAAIAATLASRGVQQATLLDEGGIIYDKAPGVSKPVAFVGIAEKGILSLDIAAHAAGGHASMPPAETAVGILGGALSRLERSPMPVRFTGAARAMIDTLAPEMSFGARTLAANLWLTRLLAPLAASRSPQLNASLRTTIAPTMISASPKENVLPSIARAVVNIRLAPGDSANDVEAHVIQVIGDRRVEVKRRGVATEASAVSDYTTSQFAALARSIRAVYPNVLVSPYLTIAATDAREYPAVATDSYRFEPILQPGIEEQIHGVNEHITIDAYNNAIRIYSTLITVWAGA